MNRPPTNENLEEAREEVKRLDHIIYVSLKYTRTVDVVRNALNRLISTFDFILEALLFDAKEKGLIESISKNVKGKADQVLALSPGNPRLSSYITFYHFIRELSKAEFTKREEYRRHVTMIVDFGDRTAELNIDNLESCEIVAKAFLELATEMIEGKKED